MSLHLGRHGAVADTRRRCASFFFMSTILSSVLKSGLALNSCQVASKAAVRVLSSSGQKMGRIVGKALFALPQAKRES